jgi:hypothetical protein
MGRLHSGEGLEQELEQANARHTIELLKTVAHCY